MPKKISAEAQAAAKKRMKEREEKARKKAAKRQQSKSSVTAKVAYRRYVQARAKAGQHALPFNKWVETKSF